MEPTRLDQIAIALGRRGSRRVLLSALTKATAGTTLAALVTVPGRQEAAARCLPLFEVCTSSKECCRHKRKRRICAANPQINDQENTCCIPEGKRCSFGGQCCGTLLCVGTSGEGRCGPL
jgi:hypothetical protein